MHMQINPHKEAMTPIQMLGVTFLRMRLLGISLYMSLKYM